MNELVPFIQAAGAVQIVILLGNFFIPKRMHCGDEIRKLSPIVRQVFIIHYIYILLVLFGFSGLCFLFADHLTGASPIGRFLSSFFAIFWGLRVLIQVFFYDSGFKRDNALGNAVFVFGFLYLSMVFSIAATGGLR